MRMAARALLVGAMLVLAGGATAGERLPDWVTVEDWDAAIAAFPQAEVVQILRSKQVEVDAENRRDVRVREAFHIREGTGRGQDQVSLSVSERVRVKSMRAWRSDPGGRVERFDKPAVVQAVGELYSDDVTLILEIPGVGAGAVVAWEIAYRSDARDYWTDRWTLHSDAPVFAWDYRLRLPRGWDAEGFWSEFATDSLRAAQPAEAGGDRVWRRGAIDVPDEPEPLAPSEDDLAPVLLVRYATPARSGIHTWSDVSGWYWDYSQTGLADSHALDRVVADLVGDSPDPATRTARIAKFVQESIGYIQIYLGDGGLRPHPAGEVYRNRYGDCKDMSHLTIAMLERAGIRAAPVLAGVRSRVCPGFPSQEFDHVIVAIEPDDSTGSLTFFDPTAKSIPPGRLSHLIEGEPALLIGGNRPGPLIRLPARTIEQNGETLRGKICVSAGLSATATVEVVALGHRAYELRGTLRDMAEQARRRWIQEWLEGRLVGSKVVEFELSELGTLGDSLTIRFEAKLPVVGHRLDDRILLQADLFTARRARIFPAKQRHRPIVLPFPERLETDLLLEIPAAWALESLPRDVSIDNDFGTFRRHCRIEDGAIAVGRVEERRRTWLPADQYSLAQDWDAAVVEGDCERLVLRVE